MNHTPEQQWSALSALYEEADCLPAHELPAWLAKLEEEANPLLPQLKRMLEAREHLGTDDFLGTLPKLSDDAAAASEWREGHRVGPYRLVKPLGEGGMAEVWLAERDDGAFKRQVAIKLPYPRPGRETFAVRFDRERDILATLRHPHIAGLFDAGVTKEGQAWLALEYVEGQPISLFCDERCLPVRERVMLFRQVLLAVQHAHANLVIHRDLKPANILVTAQGEARLLDFGIAKLLEAQGDAIEETELTRQAGRSMTPRYASPEQLTGLPLTTACDVYSLGVVFYELVSGERPYELKVESPAQLEHAILEAEPRAPSRRALGEPQAQVRGTTVKGLRKILSPELDAIALRCLEKKPSARYSSVDAVLADVDRWLAGEAVLARAPGAWYRFGKFAGRHRVGVGLGVLAVFALVVATAVAVLFAVQARQESARAMAARDFMLGLFKRADQEKARGADITARELLDTGRRDLLTRLSNQPRLQAELLNGIGTIQMEMGEYANADATFSDAARIYAHEHASKEESMVRCAHAYNALRMGNPKLAASLLQGAKDVQGRPENDPELNALLTEVAGWIANIEVRAEEARTLFEQSEAFALKAFGPNDPRSLPALRGQIYAERQLRNYDSALQLQAQLEAIVNRSFGDSPKQLAGADSERADLLNAAGRYADGLLHFQRALPRCLASLGPNEEICRRLLLSKVTALLRLGMYPEARSEFEAVASIIDERASPVIRTEALLLAFRVAAGAELVEHQAQLRGKVFELGFSGPENAINSALKTKAVMTLGESQLANAPEEALVLFERVLQPQSEGGSRPVLLVGVARALHGIALMRMGRLDEALDDLRTSNEDLSKALGSTHPLTQLLGLNRAAVLQAKGQSSEALRIVDNAEPILRFALGAESPAFGRIAAFRRFVETGASLTPGAKSRPLPPAVHSPANRTPFFFS